MQSKAFDRSVKRAPNSLRFSTDTLNFSDKTSRQCGVPYRIDQEIVCHQNNNKVGYRLIFHIFLKHL